jgi:hypothetical protein
MTSKYQRIPFDKDKLLKMQGILVRDFNGLVEYTLDYKKLKLSVVAGQLSFVTEDGLYMPIARVSTIQGIFEKDKNENSASYSSAFFEKD